MVNSTKPAALLGNNDRALCISRRKQNRTSGDLEDGLSMQFKASLVGPL
jgi:hypothetical protein